MIIVLFLKGLQLAKIKNKLSKINLCYKNLIKKTQKATQQKKNTNKITKIKRHVI